MEAELTIGGMAVPGLATFDHGNQALALRETDCYSGQRPYNLGLFHTGCGGGPTASGSGRSSGSTRRSRPSARATTAAWTGQRRYTDAEAEPMFGQPYTGGTPDEQPGSLPEILPSPDFDPSDTSAGATPTSSAAGAAARCSCRRGATTARSGRSSTSSSACGRTWDVTRSRSCRSCRRARRSRAATSGSARGRSTSPPRATGERYRTEVDADVRLDTLRIGHTLPRDAEVRSVTLDGRRADWDARTTNRGLEVTVEAGRGDHTVVVEAR